jgi:hypothetical protein
MHRRLDPMGVHEVSQVAGGSYEPSSQLVRPGEVDTRVEDLVLG